MGPRLHGTQAAQTNVQAIANTRVHNVVVDTCSQHSSSVTSLLLQLPTTTFALSFFRKSTLVTGQLVLAHDMGGSQYYLCETSILQVTKKFSQAHVARDGTLKNQPNKVGTTPQYFYTIPTSCAILASITCVHRRVVLGMESCVMSSTGCVVHVVVYGEWVVLWLAPNFVAIAGMISNSVVLYVEAVECKSSTQSVWYVGVRCFAAAWQRLSCKWKAVV